MSLSFLELPGETPIEISHLTKKAKSLGVKNRHELSVLEAKNITKAFLKYLSHRPSKKLAPFDYTWALKMHREMFGDVWQWACQLRLVNLNIGDDFSKIAGNLYGLLDDLKSWTKLKMPFVEQGARLHHRAVQIHPFANGNGRWSRLLANIWLLQNAAPLIIWPEQEFGQENAVREEYLIAIKAADANDYAPLIALHERYQEKPEV